MIVKCLPGRVKGLMFNASLFAFRFCPSIFLYLMTVLPCDWIAKREVLSCVISNNDGSSVCLRAVNGSTALYEVSQFFLFNLHKSVPVAAATYVKNGLPFYVIFTININNYILIWFRVDKQFKIYLYLFS